MTEKRKRELILIAVLCLAALLLLLWQRLGSSKRGMRVIVSQYGTVVGDYPLRRPRRCLPNLGRRRKYPHHS